MASVVNNKAIDVLVTGIFIGTYVWIFTARNRTYNLININQCGEF